MTEVEGNIKLEGEKSIEELCSNHWEPLYRYVYYKVQNREEAEDITQETFIKTISYMQRHNARIEQFESFLRTVSLNVIRDRWRKRNRRGNVVNLDDVNPGMAAIEDHSEGTLQREMIQNALSKLNEDQRTCIELRILKGYSVAETARQMGRNEGNVRVLQFRALQRLSKIIKSEDIY